MSFCAVEVVSPSPRDTRISQKEARWIHHLRTVDLAGLNEQLSSVLLLIKSNRAETEVHSIQYWLSCQRSQSSSGTSLRMCEVGRMRAFLTHFRCVKRITAHARTIDLYQR